MGTRVSFAGGKAAGA